MATTTRTRKPATTKAADAGTDQAPAVPDFTTSKAAPKAEKRKEVFRVNGEPFTVPETIGPREVWLGMDKVRTSGGVFAVMYLVELLLGPEQYARLLSHYEQRDLTEEQFDQATGLISGLFFNHINRAPATEDGEGKAPAAPDSTTS
jgi:hypothetical protein